jgi:hypothetical protein
VIITMFSDYNIMWSQSVGCLDGVDRDISTALKSK